MADLNPTTYTSSSKPALRLLPRATAAERKQARAEQVAEVLREYAARCGRRHVTRLTK